MGVAADLTSPSRILSSVALAASFALAACGGGMDRPAEPLSDRSAVTDRSSAARISSDEVRAGAVYTSTNGASGNTILAFRRAISGELTTLASYPTGGRGTGGTVDPLQSQFALVLDAGHDALFAVDAGSNELSSFRVDDSGALTLASTVPSGGLTPVSVAEHDRLVYVLNTGDNTVSGFRVAGNARLVAIPNSTRSLAAGANGAAALRFTGDGRFLIVSERVSNRLEVFALEENGRLGAPVVSAASGGASFGFDITPRNQPVVSETQGSLTSYALDATTLRLTPITASISTHGAAACWVTITADGAFAYTTNAGSNFISGFSIDAGGHLQALSANGRTGEAGVGATPIDLDHVASRFLYTLNAGAGLIGRFDIAQNGALTPGSPTPVGAPASGLQGVAAF